MPDWSYRTQLMQKIAALPTGSWNAIALEVFNYQATYNPLYRQFLELLNVETSTIRHPEQIPCLPISLFKHRLLQTGSWKPETIFTSSGTSGMTPSRHALRSADWYRKISRQTFERIYGPVQDYCWLALLPAYLERSGSSLVHMVQDFIGASRYPASGFFLDNIDDLLGKLTFCHQQQLPTVLIGVSFALLDLAELSPRPLAPAIVMETGGMKGRRRELTREELHRQLQAAFEVEHIHSEYGMTELLSQAYAPEGGLFQPAPTMRVYVREITDPLCLRSTHETGALNIIDLANVDTLSFIATDDIGRVHSDGNFEVLGRIDSAEARGCNLMVQDIWPHAGQ